MIVQGSMPAPWLSATLTVYSWLTCHIRYRHSSSKPCLPNWHYTSACYSASALSACCTMAGFLWRRWRINTCRHTGLSVGACTSNNNSSQAAKADLLRASLSIKSKAATISQEHQVYCVYCSAFCFDRIASDGNHCTTKNVSSTSGKCSAHLRTQSTFLITTAACWQPPQHTYLGT